MSDEEVVVEDVPETRLQALKKKIESHDIPIRSRLEEVEARVEEAIGHSGMFLLLGETGSGKSIYSPLAVRKVLKKLGLPDKIIVLQPTKDAAKGVAVAHCAVTEGELGRDVGYSTSETKMVERDTPVRVVTSGILPRYLFNGTVDNTNTGAIILDEVHAGSIDYHYVFGLIKQLRAEGKAPFVFLTSATVDPEKFQQFFDFDEKDFMSVEGRTFPVEKHYLSEKLQDDSYHGRSAERDMYLEQAVHYARQAIESEQEGDILVFLPGAREIDDCIERLSDIEGIEVLPLHGGRSLEERDYATSGEKKVGVRRRVIVATNIAETSLTVPNVTMVVDSCRKYSIVYNPVLGISRKVIELISQEEAEQRAGRAGRIEEGSCFRMLTQEEFDRLPKHAVTEIERTNLAHLILRLRGNGRDPETFPFFVQPDKAALHAGVEQLKILGALDAEGNVTEIGERMLEIPFKPEDARMLVEAERRGCEDAALTLALFAREQKLFMYPTAEELDRANGYTLEEKKVNAREAIAREQAQFEQDGSDWAKRLNIFIQAIEAGVFECLGDDRRPEVRRAWHEFRDWCRMYHLNAEAIKHVAYRLYTFSREAGIDFDRFQLEARLRHTDPDALNASILAGYQENLLRRNMDSRFPAYNRLQKDDFREINFSPDSSAFARPPEFCVSGSIKEGQGRAYGGKIKRNYASMIHPASLEDVVRLMGDRLKAEPLPEREFDFSLGRAVQMIRYSLSRNNEDEYLGTVGIPLEGEQATRKLAEAIAESPDRLMREGADLYFLHDNYEVLETLRKLHTRSFGIVPLPDQVEWYVARLGNVQTIDEVQKMGDFLQMEVGDFCSEKLLETVNRDYPESIEVGGRLRQIEYESYVGDVNRGVPERFRASLQLSPQDFGSIPVGTHFEIGPQEDRKPLVLRMYFEQELHMSTSAEQLRNLLGNPALSFETQSEYRNTTKKLSAMQSDMELNRNQYEKLGFTGEEFEMVIGQVRWCQEQLQLGVANDEQGKEIIRMISGTIQKIRQVLSEKQQASAKAEEEQRQRRTEALENRVREVEALYDKEESTLLHAAMGVRGGEMSSFYALIKSNLMTGRDLLRGRSRYSLRSLVDPEAAFRVLEEVRGAVRVNEVTRQGSLAAAFEVVKVGQNKSGAKTAETNQVSASVDTREIKPPATETVMTPEIREELRGEVNYIEGVLENLLAEASRISGEPVTKIRTKAQESAERVIKRKELRRDIKDLLKEIESDDSPMIVRGHVGKMRDSVNSLMKANLHQMIVGYDKNWTENFRDMWDKVPHAVAVNEEAQEYISEGLVSIETLTRDVREMLKSHIADWQRGKKIESLSELIETALGGY